MNKLPKAPDFKVGNLYGEVAEKRGAISAIVQDYGTTSNATGVYTMCLCRQAPAHFDAIQLILRGATSGANQFSASIAPSSSFNNGWQPKDSVGNNQAFTAVTWGTTDKNNPRNPGGGAATTTTAGTSGSNAGHDLIEGDSVSDIIFIKSLDRVDFPGRNPLIFIRVFGTNIPGAAVNECADNSSNPWSLVIPEHYSGYWSTTDYTNAVPPGAPTQGWIPSVQIKFFLRGKLVNCIGFAGDSVEQGWIQATAVPQFGGNVNGWPRRFCKKLTESGRPTVFLSMAHTGNKANLFHQRAITQLYRGGITHLFIKPYSANASADGDAGAIRDCARTTAIINLCKEKGVIPILIQPWGGQDSGSSRRVIVDAYIASCKAAGILVFDARQVTDNPDGSLKDEAKTLTSLGAIVDSIHLNDSYHELVAGYAFSQADVLGL